MRKKELEERIKMLEQAVKIEKTLGQESREKSYENKERIERLEDKIYRINKSSQLLMNHLGLEFQKQEEKWTVVKSISLKVEKKINLQNYKI